MKIIINNYLKSRAVSESVTDTVLVVHDEGTLTFTRFEFYGLMLWLRTLVSGCENMPLVIGDRQFEYVVPEKEEDRKAFADGVEQLGNDVYLPNSPMAWIKWRDEDVVGYRHDHVYLATSVQSYRLHLCLTVRVPDTFSDADAQGFIDAALPGFLGGRMLTPGIVNCIDIDKAVVPYPSIQPAAGIPVRQVSSSTDLAYLVVNAVEKVKNWY